MYKAPGELLRGLCTWSVLFVWLLLHLFSFAGYIVSAGRVAIAAVGFVNFIADIDRMNECIHLLADRDILLGLSKDFVAYFAILGDDSAICTLMLVVVAAEAARGIEVTDVVRVRAPLDFHLWEIVPLVNVLHVFY